MILMRYIELRSQLYRLISIMKVRDSAFDPSLHEFAISSKGVDIQGSPESAERLLSSLASNGEQVRAPILSDAEPTNQGGF